MRNYILGIFFFGLSIFLLILSGCKQSSSTIPTSSAPIGEFIYRTDDEFFGQIEPIIPLKRETYPWEDTRGISFPKITKDFFRCKGSVLNPPRIVQKGKDIIRYHDCGGTQRHSLTLRDNKEFIYPILIDLLNYIQEKSGKRVVITSGHCCPDHLLYLDDSIANQCSKHSIGAEVDFYVQGMEQEPEKIIEYIFSFYKERAEYQGQKGYEEFKRYTKLDTNVSTPPWYNEEIFIKLVKKWEGRDFDNRHSYPYICLQVRYDRDLKEKVTYSWDKANRNFHRW